ncbi:MAG: hypothetical protein IPK58_22150 [Acidobacteria bacterium]|nr:hypothetical protein [Acidobacteriota bacterium]
MSEQIQFEVGDRVWSFSRQEWGEVREIGQQGMVMVVFGPHNFGWFDPSTLFFEEIVIPPSARTRPKLKQFKPGDVVLVENFEGQPELRVVVRSDVVTAVLRVLGRPSYDYNHALLRIQPYDRTLLGFDAVEDLEK